MNESTKLTFCKTTEVLTLQGFVGVFVGTVRFLHSPA